ncbi:MAG: 30S ribosome-binding factor RbfA [Chloroflexi bacterium]|nr:30S ribosome-binding factor RbfA [Chloroflexota bacterium]
MATTKRQQRVNHLIQQEISKLIEYEMEDPRLNNITVSGVEVSPDLRHARVYVVGFTDPAREKDVRAGLARAVPFLRRELGRRVQLRLVPELSFTFDHSIDRGARIEELLREAGDTQSEA